MISLRDYQVTSRKAINTEFETVDSTLLLLATGSGKTRVACAVADDRSHLGRTLFLVEKRELANQAAEHVEELLGYKPDIEMGDKRADKAGFFRSPFVVGSIQTQIAGTNGFRRMHDFDPFEFALLILDEGHHAIGPSWRAAIDYYKQNEDIKILGLTATGDRHDGKSLVPDVFRTVAFEYDLLNAVADGWLVQPYTHLKECTHLDLSQCGTDRGDLNGADLARVLEAKEALIEIALGILEYGERKTIVFAASRAHAEGLAAICNDRKPGIACYVDHKTPDDEREELVAGFKKGHYRYFMNVGIAGEGFDCPDVEIVAMARPTASRARFAQMLGRGTRVLPGLVDGIDDAEERKQAIASSAKPNLVVLDFVGNSGRHKIVSTMDIMGSNYDEEIVELAIRAARETGAPVKPDEALRLAERKIREERKRKELQEQKGLYRGAKAKFNTRIVNPFDVLDMVPHRERDWDKSKPMSDPQRRYLTASFRVPEPDLDGFSSRRASQLIGELKERRRRGLCTFRHAKLLRNNGYDPAEISFDHASRIIDGLFEKWGKR